MRRTSLTQSQAIKLAKVLKQARIEKGYSLRRLAAVAGVSVSTVSTMERGVNQNPGADSIQTIAAALELSISDVMVTADWLPANELPSLQPYLRSKYGLTDEDVAGVADYLRDLQIRNGSHGQPGPDPHEDEH